MNRSDKQRCKCPYCDGELSGSEPLCVPCNVTVRYCPECGRPLPHGVRRCPNCGKSCEATTGRKKE